MPGSSRFARHLPLRFQIVAVRETHQYRVERPGSNPGVLSDFIAMAPSRLVAAQQCQDRKCLARGGSVALHTAKSTYIELDIKGTFQG